MGGKNGTVVHPLEAPKDYQLGPYTYEIIFDQHALNQAVVNKGDTEMGRDGEFDWNTQRIVVSPGLGEDSERETVFHEILHSITDLAGLRYELGEEKDEQFVRRLSPVILDLLQRNPELVRYLCKFRT